MNRFIFHTNQLSERGTETSLRFLASTLVSRGNEVSICYDSTNPNNVSKVIEDFNNNFPLIPYRKFDYKSRDIARSFDFAYFMKHNSVDKKYFRGMFNANHIVFPEFLPHGNTYTYISRTLAEYSRGLARKRFRYLRRGPVAKLTGCVNAYDFEFVDYIVDMPSSTRVCRADFGIPDESFVIMRIGGKESFDIPWVRDTLLRFLEKNTDTFFLAINTPVFSHSPQVKYLDTVVDLEEKASIYAISDLFLHARSLGESFGMAIVEAMQVGLPALAWYGGRDTNHRTHLEDFNLLYRNKEELWRLLEGFRSKMLTGRDLSTRLRSYAERFRPDNLIESYLEVVFRIKQ